MIWRFYSYLQMLDAVLVLRVALDFGRVPVGEIDVGAHKLFAGDARQVVGVNRRLRWRVSYAHVVNKYLKPQGNPTHTTPYLGSLAVLHQSSAEVGLLLKPRAVGFLQSQQFLESLEMHTDNFSWPRCISWWPPCARRFAGLFGWSAPAYGTLYWNSESGIIN